MKKVVFAGGTHCGKTTLVEHYRAAGYPIVIESDLPVITERKETLGLEAYRTWRNEHPEEFFGLIMKRKIELEAEVPQAAAFVFWDRGIIDTLAMCTYKQVEPPEFAVEFARKNRYDVVFLCELLPYFDDRQATGRMFTREDSEKLVEITDAEYRKFGYDPIRLPPISVEERIARINATIGLSH